MTDTNFGKLLLCSNSDQHYFSNSWFNLSSEIQSSIAETAWTSLRSSVGLNEIYNCVSPGQKTISNQKEFTGIRNEE